MGQNQSSVDIQNTMGNLEIDTLAGVAIHFVVILGFVQTEADIVKDIEQLLKGRNGIINGGVLMPFCVHIIILQ